MNGTRLMVTCPVCGGQVAAAPAAAGLVLDDHAVSGTRFRCPCAASAISRAVLSWRAHAAR